MHCWTIRPLRDSVRTTGSRLFIACLLTMSCLASGSLIGSASAQDYILKPGTRSIDSRYNRYGKTEERRHRAPSKSEPSDADLTTLRIEILMPESGGGLSAQEWSQALYEMGYSARTRSPILNDRPEVKQSTQGTMRTVTVIGALDSRGQLHLPHRSYSLGDRGELKEWLQSIKTYGAQGAPEGQPMWGLNPEQFEQLYAALAEPVRGEANGLPLEQAIKALGVPQTYRVQLSAATQKTYPGREQTPIRGSISGLSIGTALAYVLSEHNLGFKPTRLPSGDIELRVIPLPDPLAKQRIKLPVWPVGWDVSEVASSGEQSKTTSKELPLQVRIAPQYFEVAEIGLQGVTFGKAISVSTDKTNVPVLLDQQELNRQGIDPATKTINLPTRHQSWLLALKRISSSLGLYGELRRDEAGKPLFWVSSQSQIVNPIQ